jgi:predicted flavoprotein YhiN
MRADQFDVVVIGAGAGGIIASWRAASLGARVLLLEKTPRIGTKILISGGGKCNVAHAGPLADVINAFPPNEAKFIRPACYRLTNEEIMNLIRDRGIELMSRPDGRVFPVDATAKDVVAALVWYLRGANVRVCLETPVSLIQRSPEGYEITISARQEVKASRDDGPGFGAKSLLREAMRLRSDFGSVWSGPERFVASCVVVATGGSSYPNSGTTGDAWKWLRELGHTVVPVRPALAPIYLTEPLVERSGVALVSVRLKARSEGKIFAESTGDLLFTHQGISGPAVLQISRAVAAQSSPVILEVDPLPQMNPEFLFESFTAFVSKNPRVPVRSFLEHWVSPQSMIATVSGWAQVIPSTTGGQFTRKDRSRLLTTMRAWPLGPVRAVPLERGEVVAGGVSLEEVDPHSMESRLNPGLFLCGELLDVAGPVGGYNLQAAFATGYVAGESAARMALGSG